MFKKLNHLLRVFGGRCIIVEDGEPRYVLISAEEFLTLTAGKTLQSGIATPAALGEMPDHGAGMPIEDENADISEGHVSRRRPVKRRRLLAGEPRRGERGVTEDAVYTIYCDEAAAVWSRMRAVSGECGLFKQSLR
ncbi:MAG: hypothetical protein U1A16_01370 [Patescibacteria group bacterium]|nr:hypothetical protein [Patescibacteria group bacterium]